MRRELLVALLFVVHQRPERVERPCAFGASPALKILSFDPCQFATHRLHGHLASWCGYALVKNGVALVFDGTATTKINVFIASSEVLPKSPPSEHTSKPK